MSATNPRTLILGLNYSPEPTGIAPYTTKLAEGLRAQGQPVHVVTGYPHYPAWKINSGYSGLGRREQVSGVDITRLRHTVPRRPNGLGRVLMELSFGARSALTGWHSPNVVLAVSPALFAAAFAVIRARLFGVPVGIWIQDLYSKGMEETKRWSFATTAMKAFEGAILRAATGVTVIHERFRNYVVNELGVPESQVRVIRNWTHVNHHGSFDRVSARGRLGWRPDEFVALHAGNMGVKQGLTNIVEAARLADLQESRVRFVLLGDGNQRQQLERAGNGIEALTFLDPLPDQEYSEALRAADVLIVNELPGLKDMSVPSKLTSYFSTGLAVIAATEPDSATADEIIAAGAGLRIDPGRPDLLLAAAEGLAKDPAAADVFGAAGRPYAESTLAENHAISQYSSWLRHLVSP